MAATQAATPKSESAKLLIPLAAEHALVVVWARKVVLWIPPSGGKDAQTAVRRPPPRSVRRASI